MLSEVLSISREHRPREWCYASIPYGLPPAIFHEVQDTATRGGHRMRSAYSVRAAGLRAARSAGDSHRACRLRRLGIRIRSARRAPHGRQSRRASVVAQRANVVALPDANGDGQAEPTVLLTISRTRTAWRLRTDTFISRPRRRSSASGGSTKRSAARPRRLRNCRHRGRRSIARALFASVPTAGSYVAMGSS